VGYTWRRGPCDNRAVVRPLPPSSRTTTTWLGNRIDVGHDLGKSRDPGRSGRYRRIMRTTTPGASGWLASTGPSLLPSFGDAVLSCPKESLIPPPRPGAVGAACDRARRACPSDNADDVTRAAISFR